MSGKKVIIKWICSLQHVYFVPFCLRIQKIPFIFAITTNAEKRSSASDNKVTSTDLSFLAIMPTGKYIQHSNVLYFCAYAALYHISCFENSKLYISQCELFYKNENVKKTSDRNKKSMIRCGHFLSGPNFIYFVDVFFFCSVLFPFIFKLSIPGPRKYQYFSFLLKSASHNVT